MKKLSLLLVMLLLSGLNFSILAEETLIISCEDKEEFPNFLGNSLEIDWKKPGIVPEMLKMVEKKVGVKFTFRRSAWKRALEVELKEGTTQGLFTASYKKEREAFGAYPMKDGKPDVSKSFYNTKYVFYKLKGSAAIWDGKELKNLKGNISVPRGYSIGADLKAMGYVVEESDYAFNDLKKVAAGRVEVCAELELQADNILESNPDLAAKIEKISPPIVDKPYYLMLSNQFVAKNPQLADKIWTAVGEVRESDYKKLLLKYMKD
jgi:polar amino acid transport system substrate-binding protein